MKIDARSYYSGTLPIGGGIAQQFCYTRQYATCQLAGGGCTGPTADVYAKDPAIITSSFRHIVTQHKYKAIMQSNASKFYTSPVGRGYVQFDGSNNNNRQVENEYYWDGFRTGTTGCGTP
jgi:hypothetical protein